MPLKQATNNLKSQEVNFVQQQVQILNKLQFNQNAPNILAGMMTVTVDWHKQLIAGK